MDEAHTAALPIPPNVPPITYPAYPPSLMFALQLSGFGRGHRWSGLARQRSSLPTHAQQDILAEHLKILQWTSTVTLISCVKCDRSAAGLAEGWFDPNQVDSVALAAVNQTSVGSIYCRPACVTSAAREEETFQWERLWWEQCSRFFYLFWFYIGPFTHISTCLSRHS